jgi:hypothetical protein
MISRLRFNDEMVGYKKVVVSSVFFSKDLYGWNGKKLEFDTEEKSTPYKDKNAQLIFENDVLNLKEKSTLSERLYVVKLVENQFELIGFNHEFKLAISTINSGEYSVTKVGLLESI